MKIRYKKFDPIPIENEEGIDWSVDEVPENRSSGRHWLSNDYIVASLSKEQIQKQINYHKQRINFFEEVLREGRFGNKILSPDYERRSYVSSVKHTRETKEFRKLRKMILDGKLTPTMIKELLKCINK